MQIGIPATNRERVTYRETAVPSGFRDVAFCIWELKTSRPLPAGCEYLVLPDVCTDIIFDLLATEESQKVFVMASADAAERIHIGSAFHYVGIRCMPGVVPHDFDVTSGAAVWRQLVHATDTQRQQILTDYLDELLNRGQLARSPLMYRILARADELHKVRDIEAVSGYSGRQLRRIFVQKTGLTPSRFLRVLRFQRALVDDPGLMYVDQSHVIKEFKRIVGLTPGVFGKKY